MNDKEILSEHGLFWLSENDERKLWGTLRVNEINEARLETFGSLISERDGRKHRILGQIKGGQKYITLIDCFPINTQFASMKWGGRDWSHQTYVVNQALEGILFEEGEEIAFEEAILHISTLTKWVNPDLVELDFPRDETRPLHLYKGQGRRDRQSNLRGRGDKGLNSIQANRRLGVAWGNH